MSDSPVRVCVVGAGSIGGYFAARLAAAGNAVSVLARGQTLAAVREHGMRLDSNGQRIAPVVAASDKAQDLGQQDVVIIAVKAPSLPGVVAGLQPLIGPDTVIVPAINGIPWWFFLETGQALAGVRLRCVDPDGVVEAHLPMEQVVGAVVIASCSSPEPGLVRHASGDRIVFGEPWGGRSERVDRLAQLFTKAGMTGVASPFIRGDIWSKLLGNACFNPVSLLTGASTDHMIDDPRLYQTFVTMMNEILALGEGLGIALSVEPEARIAATRKLGHIKTSMLQDVEAGRPVEIDSILGVVLECAEAAGVDVPTLATVYAMACLRARTLGLMPD